MQPGHKNENKVNECGWEETLYFQAFQISGFHLQCKLQWSSKIKTKKQFGNGESFLLLSFAGLYSLEIATLEVVHVSFCGCDKALWTFQGQLSVSAFFSRWDIVFCFPTRVKRSRKSIDKNNLTWILWKYHLFVTEEVFEVQRSRNQVEGSKKQKKHINEMTHHQRQDWIENILSAMEWIWCDVFMPPSRMFADFCRNEEFIKTRLWTNVNLIDARR